MNTTRLRQARKNFVHPMAPRSVQRHNMRQWCRSIRMLGPRWLLARPIERRT